MAGTIYRNTFGEDNREVYATQRDYHFQIMQALTERGYAKVEGGNLRGKGWMGEGGGFVVHASLKEGGKAVFFMTRDAETADKVTEAIKLSVPGIALHEKIKVSAPE